MRNVLAKPKGLLTEDELLALMNRSKELIVLSPSLRAGQAFFNTLHEEYPDIADTIRGTDLDPFYKSDILVDLYEWLISGPKDKQTTENQEAGWQLCPLCQGKDDHCRVCKGEGIISIQTGKPPSNGTS